MAIGTVVTMDGPGLSAASALNRSGIGEEHVDPSSGGDALAVGQHGQGVGLGHGQQLVRVLSVRRS